MVGSPTVSCWENISSSWAVGNWMGLLTQYVPPAIVATTHQHLPSRKSIENSLPLHCDGTVRDFTSTVPDCALAGDTVNWLPNSHSDSAMDRNELSLYT